MIVGIVADSHQLSLDVSTRPQMFQPAHTFHQFSIVLRTAGDPTQLASALTAQVFPLIRTVQ